jgi:hypothetical protein
LVIQLEAVEAEADDLLMRERSLLPTFLALHQTDLPVLVIQLAVEEAEAEDLLMREISWKN